MMFDKYVQKAPGAPCYFSDIAAKNPYRKEARK